MLPPPAGYYAPRVGTNRRVAQEFAALVGGIDAEEIMAMAPDEQLLLMDGKLLRLRRLRYFEEECFAGQYDATVQSRHSPYPSEAKATLR